MRSDTTQVYKSASAALTASDTTQLEPCRAVLVTCTVAGNLVFVLEDGSTVTYAAAVGASVILPFSVIQYKATGKTATATVQQLT